MVLLLHLHQVLLQIRMIYHSNHSLLSLRLSRLIGETQAKQKKRLEQSERFFYLSQPCQLLLHHLQQLPNILLRKIKFNPSRFKNLWNRTRIALSQEIGIVFDPLFFIDKIIFSHRESTKLRNSVFDIIKR